MRSLALRTRPSADSSIRQLLLETASMRAAISIVASFHW